ncbi:PIR Superfamily Protein [Plasmodium ovale wallikeri]|uniref:PIR Superfamily Protein n=2 Tax=Plasmodium ovale TaxID=36330 RepID=A0A1A9ATR3_PLAOA|nr:PIR Superfamily Protein [Plasmodium ovale wallikeri]SBT59517.1 PIR Superfamily Protein [Plasmodium ovale wallikeri]SBT72896.1 PIR protein [Plasmodium ovale]
MGNDISGFFPSEKNNENLKESIRYDSIFSYIEKHKYRDINKWIGNIQRYLDVYIKSNASSWSDSVRPKCCSDMNYILDIIAEEFVNKRSLNDNIKYMNQLNNNSKGILNANRYLGCLRDFHSDVNEDRHLQKKFNDFCEDRSYIISMLNSIKEDKSCSDIISRFNNKRNKLIQELEEKRKTNTSSIYGDKCKIDTIKLDNKYINCNSEKVSEKDLESEYTFEKLVLSIKNPSDDANEESAQRPGQEANLDDPSPGHADEVTHETSNDETQPYRSASIIGATSVGTLSLLLLLYKVTPIGSLFNSKLRSTNNMIPNHYEGSENVRENYYDPLKINSENDQFNMLYNPVGDF